MTTEAKRVKLGDLLIRAGFLRADILEEAIRKASEAAIPIGRVLVMAGQLSDTVLHAAIQVQSMVRDDSLTEEGAVAVIKLVGSNGLSLEAALNTLTQNDRQDVVTAKLGEILSEAELIKSEHLAEALKTSQETGLPLGRILVLAYGLSEELLASALNAQNLVREGKIMREQALAALRAAYERKLTLEEVLSDSAQDAPPVRKTIKLGELLVLSEMVIDSDLITALELGLVRQKPIGQALLEAGLVEQDVLDNALKLQQLIAIGEITILQAAQALRSVALDQIALPQALAELDLPEPELPLSVKLGDILKAARILTENDIKQAIDLGTQNASLLGKLLLATGKVDEKILHASLRSQLLIREGLISMEQAILILNQCKQTGQTFDEVVKQRGWKLPAPWEN